MNTQIIINIERGYDRRGRKIRVNLSDGIWIAESASFFNPQRARKYIDSLIASGYPIEQMYSQKNYEIIIEQTS